MLHLNLPKAKIFIKVVLPAFVVILTSSCATVFNKKFGKTEIHTSETVNYVYEGDTLINKVNAPFTIYRKKEKEPFDILLFNETESRQLSIDSKVNWMYWGNATSYLFLGFLVDEISKRKFTYPKKVYVDLSQNQISYLPYIPMNPILIDKKNKISFNLLSFSGLYHPRIEFSFQRLHGERFATQISYSHILSNESNYARNAKGYKLGIEEKYFIRNADDYRIYTSLVFEFLRKNHEDSFEFLIPDNTPDNIFDNDRSSQIVAIEKRFISLTPRVGFEKYLTQRLVFDTYFGVGLRYRKVRLPGTDKSNLFPNNRESYWGNYRYDSNKPDDKFAINFDLNFRIGWTF